MIDRNNYTTETNMQIPRLSPFQSNGSHIHIPSQSHPQYQSSKKRGRDEEESDTDTTWSQCESSSTETSPIKEYNGNPKRWQRQRIHTQAHQNTVSLMMQSQRLLQEQERLAKLGDGMIIDREPTEKWGQEDNTDLRNDSESSFKQKPFWPLSAKSKRI